MDFIHFRDFLLTGMRMSHIYQPVMLKHLLLTGGKATDVEIASQLLQYDEAELEYYQNITNRMVGQVLRKRGIVAKDKNTYHLPDYARLSRLQINELINICDVKVDEYIRKRGEAIWSHRSKSRKVIPGTIRYEVLKRAQFRCELCGISASEKALEVDHIVQKNHGGEDSLHNYQALCYTCNASKGDRDATDFREAEVLYEVRKKDCTFCHLPSGRIQLENHLAVAILDLYPVTNGHTLVIPKRHTADYFLLNQPEINAINDIIHKVRQNLQKKDAVISGFNIGMNCGSSAGQTIFHTHIHMIPRRERDVADPTGGVRNIIPEKGNYLSTHS